MDPKHQKALQENQVFLLANITYSDICDLLIEKDLLTFDKHEEIDCEKGNKAKVRALLSYLRRGGPTAFPKFVSIFEECDTPRPDIVKKLCPHSDTVDGLKKDGSNQNSATQCTQETSLFDTPHPLTEAATYLNQPVQSASQASGDAETEQKCGFPIAESSAQATSQLALTQDQDWFYTSLTDTHRSMLCQDKLFAKLSQYISDVSHLGIWLGFERGEINQIQLANSFSVANQVLELLQRWQQRTYEHTVERLVKAMRQADIPQDFYKQAIKDFCTTEFR